MRLLITGIHGFVGSNIVKALSGAYQIYGLDIVAPEKEGVVKTYLWEDLAAGNLPEVDAIIHLAGKAHDTKNQAAAESYFAVNTGLTQRIFDHYLSSTASKFIFFSSVKAAADSVQGDILTEDVVPQPVGPYGESKIKAEQYIESQAPQSGKNVYILRPCMIHGPGNKGNLNLLYGVVRRGIPWPLGSFENLRTFTSVDNLTFVIDKMLRSDIQSGIYHMADDQPLSTNELIAIICSVMGRKCRIWHINRAFITFCAKIGTILHLPLNSERLRKLTENYVVSNAKLKQAIGIDKMPISAAEGLKKTIESFSER